MKSKLPDPRSHALFEALARHQSLPAAAASLGLNTIAFARSLNALRKQLADPMFVRSMQGLAPATQAARRGAAVMGDVGAAVGAGWREMFDAVRDRLDPAPRFDARGTERPFQIALDDAAMVAILPRLHVVLRKHAPRARLVVHALEALRPAQALAVGGIDLAIGFSGATPRRATGLRDAPLYADSIVAVLRAGKSPSVAKRSAAGSAARKALTVAQLRAARHLVVGSALDAPQIGAIGALLAENIPASRMLLAVPSFAIAGSMVARSDYLVLAPASVAQEWLAQQLGVRVVQIARLPQASVSIAVRMTWHEKFHRDAAVHWLREMVHTELGDR